MAEENGIGGIKIQDKLVMLLAGALLVSTGGIGFLYGQLSALKGNVLGSGSGGAGQVAQAQPQGGTQPAAPSEPISDDLWNEMLAKPAAAKGDESAKVTLVEFTDYQCPFCKRHFDDTASRIDEEYVNTGKVYYVARDLPLAFHGNANSAALAARCAGDQGKYWEMHDELFSVQQDWSNGDPETLFSEYAGNVGLNVASFDSCLSSEKYKDAVEEDLALARKVGASGTPTFFVNGKILVGAQPFESFKALIEEEL